MIRYVTYAAAALADSVALQQQDIADYLATLEARSYKVLADFVDADGGVIALAQAIERARKDKATLLVAGVESLPADALSEVVDDPRVELLAARMPDSDKYQLLVYAAVAQQERAQVRQNIKEALAQSQKKLGGLREATRRRNEALQKEARIRAQGLAEIILPLREQGYSLRAIAAALTEAGHLTPQGRPWQAVQIKRLFDRLDAAQG